MEFNFDLSVAGQHSYLGSGGQERNKKIIYPANTILDIPILEEINTIILPGQDVPINAVSSKTKRLIREVLGKKVCWRKPDGKFDGFKYKYINLNKCSLSFRT